MFDRIRDEQLTVVVSDVVLFELRGAPKHVVNLLKSVQQSQVERVRESQLSLDLSEMYIAEKVVGRISLIDRRHIALATLNRVDVLVS